MTRCGSSSLTFAPRPSRSTRVRPTSSRRGLVITTEKATFRVEVLTKDLFTPWAIAFLPDGRLLVTERNGTIRILDKANNLSEPVKNTPKAHVQQDGGISTSRCIPSTRRTGGIYLTYYRGDARLCRASATSTCGPGRSRAGSTCGPARGAAPAAGAPARRRPRRGRWSAAAAVAGPFHRH